MDDDGTPVADNSNESNPENDLDEERKIKCMKERQKLFNSMSKYEKKLMKGLMKGFGNTMILWLISKKRMHGYEIMTKLHESTAPYNTKMPSASKIYPVLHDLEKNNMIEGSWEHHGKRKVKYYKITAEGEEALSRFKEIARIAKKNKSSLWLEFFRDMIAVEDE
ncbi:PadR family transcriptional regulator [Methanobacterium sp.]|uniref:PadR family transcriptional regulator n=1 Tax=Methanobacterium sp. TaxID=2164 RepID=UPI003C71DA58